MSMKLNLGQVQRQELRMTQQLQQAIKLLQLTRMELVDAIQAEIMENPVLEESEIPTDISEENESNWDEDIGFADMETEHVPEKNEINNVKEQKDDDIDWDSYLNEYQSLAPEADTIYGNQDEDEYPGLESRLSNATTLSEYLGKQAMLSSLEGPALALALEIIGNLDEDGYLKDIVLEELAQKHGLAPEDAEDVLSVIQEMDPTGVGARSLEECLMIQARTLYPDDDVMMKIILKCIPLLERKNYDQIAKELKITTQNVVRAAKKIATLNPRPGIIYCCEKAHYITPDVYIEKMNDDYVVLLNADGMPKLRVSPYYAELIRKNARDKEASGYIRDKMQSAKWFIKSIQQRESTICKVTEAIIVRQREFFEKGSQYLKPMVLRDIAEDTGLSESTVSRITTKKYVHTPKGTFELKYFFNSRVTRSNTFDDDCDVASQSVKEKIKQIIAGENSKKPLSDQAIADLLLKDGIEVARRTVAKYRESLGILSSGQRKSFFD